MASVIYGLLNQPRERYEAFLQPSTYRSPALIAPFAAVGALYLLYKTFSFLRLLLSLFVIPGKPVS